MRHSTYINETIRDRYEVRELLGEGGMGSVFRVWDRQTRSEGALKLIDIRNKKFPLETVLRFRAEAETLKSLRHPGIIRYVDYFEEDDMHALLMEYISGPTLRSLIDEQGAQATEIAIRLLRSLSEALLYLHEKGLVHHDLKSSNILIAEPERLARATDSGSSSGKGAGLGIRLVDFGLSHLVGAQERHFAGTLAYMAPEQTGMLNKMIDHRADLYALGVLLYEVLTGQLPFQDSDPAILMHMHVAATPRKPTELAPGIPKTLEAITLKLLSKDPDDRYRTASGLIRDLDRLERLHRPGATNGRAAEDPGVFALGEEDHWHSFPRRNPFMDRETEREELLGAIAALDETNRNENPGRLILLDGTRGIGKTELLNTIFNEVQPQPGVTWFHTARKEETEIRHKTIRALLKNFMVFLGSIPEKQQLKIVTYLRAHFRERFETFLELVPELRDWSPEHADAKAELENDSGGSSQAQAGAAADAEEVGFEFMQTVARHQKRLVVFIDDFHNVEISSSRALLERFSELRALPIIFIFAYNHELLPERHKEILHRMRGEAGVHFSRLETLTEAVCGELLQQLFSRKLGDLSSLLDPLYATTGGNPGTLRLILQTLIDRKIIYFDQDNWQTRLPEALEFISGYRGASQSGSQLEAFGQGDLDLLRRSAVFQRAFTLDALEAILEPLSGPTVSDSECGPSGENDGDDFLQTPEPGACNHRLIQVLDRAVKAGVLSVDSNRLYAFRDPALRTKIRDELPQETRRAIHSSIAGFLERVVLPNSPDAIYDIAHHQEHAGDLRAALNTYETAAKKSFESSFTNRQSQLYYDLAYRIIERLPPGSVDDQRTFEILFHTINHDNNLNPTRALIGERLERLERLAGQDTARRIRYLTVRALHCFYSGRKSDMIRYGEELLALGDSPEYAELTLPVYFMFGTTPTGKSFRERAGLLLKGINIALDLKRGDLIPAALTVYMNMLAYLGRFKEAERELERIMGRLTEQESEIAKIAPLFATGVLQGERGEFKRLLDSQSTIDIDKLPIPEIGRQIVRAHRARAQGMEGHFREALQVYESLIELSRDTSNRSDYALVMHGRILLALRMEEPEEALEFVERGHRHLSFRPDPYVSAMYNILGAQAYLMLGQTSDALEYINQARDSAQQLDSQLLDAHLEFVAAKLDWQQSRDENYIAVGEAVLEHFRNMDVTGYYNIYREDLKQWRNLYSDSSSHTIMGGGENRELVQLMEINRKISSTLDTNLLLELVLKGAMQIVGARHGYLYTCDDPDDADGASTPLPQLQISQNAGGEAIPEAERLLSRTILHTTIASRSAILTREARREKRWEHSKSVIEKNLRSVLSVPILLRDKILGVLYLDNQQASSVFTVKDREIVENFATQVAIAMNNASIFQREQEARARTEATLAAFSRFVPRQFTERFAEGNVELLQTGLSRQESLSILFSDVRGFTTVSEALGSEKTFLLLNDYLERMETPIRRHDGFVDKFIGDAIMALFDGAAVSAVNAGLEMLATLDDFNRPRISAGEAALRIGIGVNTGDVMIGVVGSRERMDTTVMGDTVNTASRIENLTKYYGCDFLIGENTYQAIQSDRRLLTRFVDAVQVKGKDASTRIYEVFNHDSEELREKKQEHQALFNEAIATYQAADWSGATRLFGEYYAKIPEDKIVTPFLERCERFQTLPPDDWAGIYRLDSK
ncbi:MAG: protein kinase [Leptospirales bacterium]|jgi:serine/threonine protein kinase/class 3 adenylate cyclase/tetratricopeptide (TPR) repeat protein